jgi:hypothetical protein
MDDWSAKKFLMLIPHKESTMVRRLWHQFQHDLEIITGHFVTATDRNGNVWMGFRCNTCSSVSHVSSLGRMGPDYRMRSPKDPVAPPVLSYS